ncbi:MAG: hypothetical protein ACYC35_14620 [Pirellulales bacterium]
MWYLANSATSVGFGCLLAVAVLATGCSKGPPMGEVTGTITVDGTPAKIGSISFFPIDGKSGTAGAAIKDGKYTAKVPAGKVKVEIRVSKVVGEKKLYDTPNSPVQPIMQEVLPPTYHDRTTLELDVQPGANEKNYALKTKP